MILYTADFKSVSQRSNCLQLMTTYNCQLVPQAPLHMLLWKAPDQTDPRGEARDITIFNRSIVVSTIRTIVSTAYVAPGCSELQLHHRR